MKETKKDSIFVFLENMFDCLLRTTLAGVTGTVAVLSLASEFFELPVQMPKFSNFSIYFLCLAATAHVAWCQLGKGFEGRNSPAGGFFLRNFKKLFLIFKNFQKKPPAGELRPSKPLPS